MLNLKQLNIILKLVNTPKRRIVLFLQFHFKGGLMKITMFILLCQIYLKMAHRIVENSFSLKA